MVEWGSTPCLHSELISYPVVEKDESLEITLGIETSTKGENMKLGTKLKFSYRSSAWMKVTLVMIILGLCEFGAGPAASIDLSL